MFSSTSSFTTTTPLPSSISRESVLQTLHNHSEMIELNPLVVKYERCAAPATAPSEELEHVWFEITDKISYLPIHTTFKASFESQPAGLRTHVYAPMGLEIKGLWSVGEKGSNGEEDALRDGGGLYLREDVEMKCPILMGFFVRRTLENSHGVLVERLVSKTDARNKNADGVSDAA